MNLLKATIAIALGTSVTACSIDIDAEGYDHNYRSNIERTSSGLGFPFSSAVRYGNILYLSGQVGEDMDGKLVEGGITAETRQTLMNIDQILKAHNLDRSNVIKCTVFIDDISKWGQMNDVYAAFFGDELPARSALGADGLALGAALEIECIAAYD